jgi:hypothetical protein
MKRIFEGFWRLLAINGRSLNPLPTLPHSFLPVNERLFFIKMPEDPRRIWRGVDVAQGYRQAEQEMVAEFVWEHVCDEPLADPTASVEMPAGSR